MFKFSEGAVQVVAAESRDTVSDFDTALATGYRFAANAIDVIRKGEVPVGTSQRVYRALNASFQQMVEGRSSLVSAIAQLQVLHRHSNQAEVDIGCPRDPKTGGGNLLEFFISGEADAEQPVAISKNV